VIANLIRSGLPRFASTPARTWDAAHPRDPAIAEWFTDRKNSVAGVAVTDEKVLGLPSVLRGVNIISNGLGKLDLDVYRTSTTGRNVDRRHFARRLISSPFGKPNDEMSIDDFMSVLVHFAILWGNGVAAIERDESARPVSLIPLLPDRTYPFRRMPGGEINTNIDTSRGQLMYGSRIGGAWRSFLPENVLHIKGLTTNGIWGLSVGRIVRETFGSELARREHGARLFGQGANIAGFVTMPHGLDEEAAKNFKQSMREATSGLGSAFKIIALEEVTKFIPTTMPNKDAQFLELAEFNRQDIANIIGIQASKLGDRKEQSYNSLEQSNQEHKDDDLCPWINKIRNEFSEKLLTERQKQNETHIIDYDDSRLEWVPYRDRVEGAVRAFHGGLTDRDEGRERIGYPPSRDEQEFLRPANIQHDDDVEVIEPLAPPIPPEPEESMEARLMLECLQSVMTRLCRQANKKTKTAGEFIHWLDELEEKQGSELIHGNSQPMVVEFKRELNTIIENVTNDQLVQSVSEYTSVAELQLPKEYMEVSK